MEKAQEVLEAGIRAEEAGDCDQALRLYEQASLIDRKDPLPRLRLAFLLHQQGKWKDAIRVGRQLTKRWPRLDRAYCLIARGYAELGRWRMAERFYRQSLAVKQDAGTLLLLGWALDRLGRHDEAVECLHRAHEVDPDDDEVNFNLGYLYRARGEFAAAEKHLRRAIEIDPEYALACAELGAILVGQEDRIKEAVGLLKKALKYNPDDGWSKAYLACALRRLRRLKAAEEQLRELMELWPDVALPYWLYGDFLARENKNWSTAEKYMRKAVEIAPRDREANYYLGKLFFYSNRDEEARRFLIKAARLGHPRARKLLRRISA